MKGCVNTLVLLKCPRSQARKVSSHSNVSFRSKFLDRLCEQMCVIEVPLISSQESVEAVKVLFQDRISQRMCEQIGVSEVSKVSSQESVEAVENCHSGANF